MSYSLQTFLIIWGAFVLLGSVFSAVVWLVFLAWTHLFPAKPEPTYQYDAWKNWDPYNPR